MNKKFRPFAPLKPRQESFRRDTTAGLVNPNTLPKSGERVEQHPNLDVPMTEDAAKKQTFRGVTTRQPAYPWMHNIPLNER